MPDPAPRHPPAGLMVKRGASHRLRVSGRSKRPARSAKLRKVEMGSWGHMIKWGAKRVYDHTWSVVRCYGWTM